MVFGLFIGANAQTNSENFIKTTIFKDANGTNPSSSVTYFDGLGRPIQNIAQGHSASGNDIITHIEYDAFGRQPKDFLPFVSGSNNMAFDTNGQSNTFNFYGNSNMGQQTTNYPYSQKLFEASPLNRVMKQAALGDAWAMGSTHEIKLDYQTNHGTEVANFVTTTSWEPSIQLYEIGIVLSTANNGFYASNQLYKNITYDENNVSQTTTGSTEEFKDKDGKVVLKRTYSNVEKHDTYYVYDIYGNLTYVLPPKANGLISDEILNNLCYQYKYDYRNRLVEKKLPGKQWEFIVYDKLDRVVATGPAFSPFPDLIAQGKTGWMITKYDVFNRPIYTAWEMVSTPINAAARALKQSNHNSATILNETKTTATTLDGIAIAYTNNVSPTNLKLLTVNYYDDYNYPNAPQNFNAVFGETVYYNNTQKPKGMPTGSWVRVLESSTATRGESSYTLYDYKARPIRSFMQNYLGGYTQVDSKLDFMGKTMYTETRHKRTTAIVEILVREDFTYSLQDRLLTHTHKINNQPTQTLTNNEYTELGQLKTKLVGNYPSSTEPLQKVDYQYNIRGWLTEINNINSLAQSDAPTDLFSFKLNYNNIEGYGNGVKALYNGNIAEAFWRTSADNKLRNYGYIYDNLNRLTEAIYQKRGTAIPNSFGEFLTYDKNGNILSLTRNGGLDGDTNYFSELNIDKLAYRYAQNSNQLQEVYDYTLSPQGFSDGETSLGVDDYNYDANGNLIADNNKNIREISYNHLNLPTTIIFQRDGSFPRISYLYNAVGQKLRKIVNPASRRTPPVTTDYLSGFQYRGFVLQFFPHTEGYVNVTGGNMYNYVYNYTDHLGNIRLSYGLDQNNVLKILEENNYYPFGLKHDKYNNDDINYRLRDDGNIKMMAEEPKNIELFSLKAMPDNLLTAPLMIPAANANYNYKYNGKELQDELGLNVYDYGARNYDPALGRWMNVDALADMYPGISPYVYTLNNPILFIDPDGNYVDDSFIYEKDKKGNYINPALVKAWTVFANSKQGISFLSNFAEKGQKIAGHRYEESGKYDLKNIDLSFKKLDDNDIANAKTDYEKKGNGLQINILLSQTNTSVPENIKEIGHESFIHGEMFARDFHDNKKLDNSTDNKEIVKWVDDAIKNQGYPKNWRANLIQHTQEINNKILNAKLLPILQDYYKNTGIKKNDAEIIKKINGYIQ